MKVLDYLLLVCAIAICVANFFVYSPFFTLIACLCGGVLGGRIGGRIYKKNQENK